MNGWDNAGLGSVMFIPAPTTSPPGNPNKKKAIIGGVVGGVVLILLCGCGCGSGTSRTTTLSSGESYSSDGVPSYSSGWETTVENSRTFSVSI